MKSKKKIVAEYCPKCKDVEMVKIDDKVEVFQCMNCKFKIKKNEKKK